MKEVLTQLQAEWAWLLDEGFREERERLLDLGWHVGLVYPKGRYTRPLIALKYLNTAIVWIKWPVFLAALAELVAVNLAPHDWDEKLHRLHTEDEDEERPDSWIRQGDDLFVIKPCGCGHECSNQNVAAMWLTGEELYIGYFSVLWARGINYDHYGLPLPVQMPLSKFWSEFTRCSQAVLPFSDQDFDQSLDDEYEFGPDPDHDGYLVTLDPEGSVWHTKPRRRWAWETEVG